MFREEWKGDDDDEDDDDDDDDDDYMNSHLYEIFKKYNNSITKLYKQFK